jgi:hypothetical protein
MTYGLNGPLVDHKLPNAPLWRIRANGIGPQLLIFGALHVGLPPPLNGDVAQAVII